MEPRGDDDIMIGLLVYGSLMNPAELADHLTGGDLLIPVRVRGFRRSFCQEPSWRRGEGEERGVLTVSPSANDWFNAILVCGWEAEVFDLLDHRERGYTREVVPSSALELYREGDSIEAVRQICVYMGREEKRNEGLTPNSQYLKICTEAARSWGEAFLSDFLSTTFVGPNALRAVDEGPSSRL